MGKGIRRLAALTLVALCPGVATASEDDGLVVAQVSTSPDWSAGEGWVVATARNPNVLAAVWTGLPYASPLTAILSPPGPHPIHCGLAYSIDGGKTWFESALPYQPVGLPVNAGGCADPTLAEAPDGTLYSVFNGGSVIPGLGTSTPGLPSLATLTSSKDGGRTWADPTKVWSVEDTPGNTLETGALDLAFDRPWLTIDAATSTLYVSLSDDTIGQRVVLASRDGGVTWGTAYPLDPDGQTTWGDQISAANGVLAAAYAVNPGSARYLLLPSPAVTCAQVCAVFQTSIDDGRTWARTVMPVENPRPGPTTPTAVGLQVAADPSRAGRFAVLVPKSSSFEVWTTPDAGASWPPPFVVNAPDGDTLIHPTVAFGSNGALGVVWRGTHSDRSYDIHVAVSRDGGNTFGPDGVLTPGAAPPNAAVEPATPGDDCACNLHLDDTYLYATWGDSRTGQRQLWFARYRYSSSPSASLNPALPEQPTGSGGALEFLSVALLFAARLCLFTFKPMRRSP